MSYSPQTGYVYIPALEAALRLRAGRNARASSGGPACGTSASIRSAAAIPDDEAMRKAIRASTKGRLVAWDPIAAQAGVDGRAPGAVERRPAVDRQRPAVPGHRPRHVRGLRGRGRQEAVGVPRPDRHHRRAGHLRGRRRAIRRPSASAGAARRQRPSGEIVLDAAKAQHQPRADLQARRARQSCRALKTAARPLDPPPATAPAEKVADGKRLYQTYCMICHGDTAVSGGMVPDLRYSATLPSADAWKSIVLDGRHGQERHDFVRAAISRPTTWRRCAPTSCSARTTRRSVSPIRDAAAAEATGSASAHTGLPRIATLQPKAGVRLWNTARVCGVYSTSLRAIACADGQEHLEERYEKSDAHLRWPCRLRRWPWGQRRCRRSKAA